MGEIERGETGVHIRMRRVSRLPELTHILCLCENGQHRGGGGGGQGCRGTHTRERALLQGPPVGDAREAALGQLARAPRGLSGCDLRTLNNIELCHPPRARSPIHPAALPPASHLEILFTSHYTRARKIRALFVGRARVVA